MSSLPCVEDERGRGREKKGRGRFCLEGRIWARKAERTRTSSATPIASQGFFVALEEEKEAGIMSLSAQRLPRIANFYCM